MLPDSRHAIAIVSADVAPPASWLQDLAARVDGLLLGGARLRTLTVGVSPSTPSPPRQCCGRGPHHPGSQPVISPGSLCMRAIHPHKWHKPWLSSESYSQVAGTPGFLLRVQGGVKTQW